MNATEFGAALGTVEQDHRLVLEKMRMLRDVVRCLFDGGDEDPQRVLDRLAELNRYFATEFEAHLEEEEATLFPLLERHQRGGRDLVACLRQEHAELRRTREEFGNCLEVGAELEGVVPPAVLRDLLTYGWEFWVRLDNHAHTETRALQQCVAQSLAADGAPA